MHGSSNALRVEDIRTGHAGLVSIARISEFKRAPMHFNFNIPLREQAELKRDEYKLTDEEIAPFLGYLESREWTPANLPAGADAWAVVGDSAVLFDDYSTATATAINKLRLRYTMFVNAHMNGMIEVPARCSHTQRCLALLRQVQGQALLTEKEKKSGKAFPRLKLLVMPVQLGFSDHHKSFSPMQAEPQLAKNEFGLGDFELSNVLATYPGCMESPQDRGLIAMGDRCNGDYATSYQVGNRMLQRQLKRIDDIDHGCRVATGFLYK